MESANIVILFILLAAIPLLMAFTSSSKSETKALQARLDYTNSRLDQIAQSLGLPELPIINELRTLVKEGKKPEATRKAMRALGLPLKQAAAYVQSL